MSYSLRDRRSSLSCHDVEDVTQCFWKDLIEKQITFCLFLATLLLSFIQMENNNFNNENTLLRPLSIFPLYFFAVRCTFYLNGNVNTFTDGDPVVRLRAQHVHALKRPHTQSLALESHLAAEVLGLLLGAKPDRALSQALIILLLILNDNSNIKHALQKEEKRQQRMGKKSLPPPVKNLLSHRRHRMPVTSGALVAPAAPLVYHSCCLKMLAAI